MDDIDMIIKLIKESNKTVFFGGAGVSTESGMKDFRSKDGLYNEIYDFPPERILSHSFFFENPNEFYKFYKDKLNVKGYNPNITHKVLKEMEDKGLLSSIITQNIDGLHTLAGSKNVLELHGTVYKNHCIKCNKEYNNEFIFNQEGIPRCTCGGIVKPDVVLYEEPLDNNVVRKAIEEISSAELLIIGGTSLSVYPAAGLIRAFKGKNIILINKDITESDYIANIVIHDSLGNVFKKIKEAI